jgi:hypothetical protein
VRRLATVAAVVILLLVVLSAGVVAASQPGQPIYALRVIVERAPALAHPDPGARATRELSIADRRLTDLQQYLARGGRVEAKALAALLAGDQAASRQALRLDLSERLQVAQRLALHARLLDHLATNAANPHEALTLRRAAQHMRALAGSVRRGESLPPWRPLKPAPEFTPSATASATATRDPSSGTPSPAVTISPAGGQEDPKGAATGSPSAGSQAAEAIWQGGGEAGGSSQATPVAPTGMPTPAFGTPRPRRTPAPDQPPLQRPRLRDLIQTATARASTARSVSATLPAQPSGPVELQLTARAARATARAAEATIIPPRRSAVTPSGTPRPPDPRPRSTATTPTATPTRAPGQDGTATAAPAAPEVGTSTPAPPLVQPPLRRPPWRP